MVALAKAQPNTYLPTGEVIHGDALAVLQTLPDCSMDAIVTDPPAAVSFMGREWDSDRGGRTQWVAWLAEIMREALRCLKPGGYGFVWALPRTSHWTAIALEDSGWQIREKCYHLFGSGFPKSKNLGEGVGSALKPAVEEWILCRKPLSESSLEANYRRWGTGGLNIDASRVSHNEPLKTTERTAPRYSGNTMNNGVRGGIQSTIASADPSGRFPANLLLSHSIWCTPRGVKRVPIGGGRHIIGKPNKPSNVYGHFEKVTGPYYGDADGMEEIEDWECVEECPIRLLNEQSGICNSHGNSSKATFKGMFGNGKPVTSINSPDDKGGASRYFTTFHYFSKASRAERNRGCEGLPLREAGAYGEFAGDGRGRQTEHTPAQNVHPCVKSLSLMSWLVRLVTPPGGTVLDPFAGSGSTLVACVYEGFSFIGIDAEEEYCSIARARIARAESEVGLWY